MVSLPTDSHDAPADSIPMLVSLLIARAGGESLPPELFVRLEAYAAARHDRAERAHLFTRLALVAGRGAPAVAERLAIRAFNCAERVEDAAKRVHVLCDLAAHFSEGGDAAHAREACQRAAVLSADLPLGDARKQAILEVGAALGRVFGVERGIAWVEPLGELATELTAPRPASTNGMADHPVEAPESAGMATNGFETTIAHRSHRRRRRH